VRQSKWKSKTEKRARKAVQLQLAEERLDGAITIARNHYTGFLGSKGSVFDDPKVRAAMRHRDRILRDLGRIAKS